MLVLIKRMTLMTGKIVLQVGGSISLSYTKMKEPVIKLLLTRNKVDAEPYLIPAIRVIHRYVDVRQDLLGNLF